jgi:hypothetical protein
VLVNGLPDFLAFPLSNCQASAAAGIWLDAVNRPNPPQFAAKSRHAAWPHGNEGAKNLLLTTMPVCTLRETL